MSGQGIAQFIPLILIFVIFYFFLIRPQQKRVKDHRAMVQGLKRGDEVITQAFNFVATIEAIKDLEAKPVICNIDETLNMDMVELETLITKKTNRSKKDKYASKSCYTSPF